MAPKSSGSDPEAGSGGLGVREVGRGRGFPLVLPTVRVRRSRASVSERIARGELATPSPQVVAHTRPPRWPAGRAACLAPPLLIGVVVVGAAALTLGLGPALESLVLSGGPGPWFPAAVPSAHEQLTSVSCTGGDDCWASGADALAHWTGGGWASLPVTSGFGPATLTCVSDNDCWAAGDRFAGMGAGLSPVSAAHSTVEHLTAGTWTRLSAPGSSYGLTDVACVTVSDCWGLGSVIEHWAGDGWQAVPSPAGQGTNASLSAVTCAGVDECWAVGSTITEGTEYALIEEFAGGTWTVRSRGAATTALDAVTCAGAGDCWAVGCSAATTAAGCAVPGSGLVQPLIEHYAGGEWQVVTSPSIGALGQGYLTGVACSTSNDCWTVGSAAVGVLYVPGMAVPTIPPVLMRYSSGRWTLVHAPQVAGQVLSLNAISCVPDGTCWAVGGWNAGPSRGGALVETPSPDAGA